MKKNYILLLSPSWKVKKGDIMEEGVWKRDETPYHIFQCSKCGQYQYVKSTQRIKKCLRCGRQHQVVQIKKESEIVNGITNAVDIVKQRQNELAVKELGYHPEFRAFGDFNIGQKPKKKIEKKDLPSIEADYTNLFQYVLKKLSEFYSFFPLYILEMFAENYGIPSAELKLLITNFRNQGLLIKLKDSTYKISL